MRKGGLYIYCVVSSKHERNFRSLGIGKADVLTISYDDLSMLASYHPLARIAISRENILVHERVIERIMLEFDSVLPVRFGTIAANADEIRGLLDRRRNEFLNLLRYVEHRIELNVKGIWKKMSEIYAEIVRENPVIRDKKEKILQQSQARMQEKYEVGRLVEKALLKKKEEEANAIVNQFRKTATEVRLNKTSGDEMFVNAAFLVDRGREKEFDNLIDEVDKRHHKRTLLKYTGPLPTYNFVNVILSPPQAGQAARMGA